MYRLTILYGRPDDPDAFDTYYRERHIPLAGKMTGLARWTITPVESPDPAQPSPYHLIVDLYAASREAMQAVLDSPEGRAARDDLANFATGGAVFLTGAEESLPVS